MEKYTGRKVNEERFTNPFRDDLSPKCYFEFERGKLYLRDWASDIYGDVFSIAKQIHKDVAFPVLLGKIKEDVSTLGLVKIEGIQVPSVVHLLQESVSIHAKVVDFTSADLAWWKHFTQEELHAADIFRALRVYIDDNVFYNFKRDEPCYVYKQGDKLKIYRPLAPEHLKWRTNILRSEMEGDLSPQIVTKSRKDRILLSKCGFSVANTQSEEVREIDRKFEYLLFDNDKTGIRRSQYFVEKYGCKLLTVGDEKDAWDYGYKYGLEELRKVILKQMNEVR